jgi:isochorismate synthase
MKNIFSKIQQQLEAQLPFAVYSKPGSAIVTGLFQKDDKQHFLTNYTKKGFAFAPFKGKACFIPLEDAEVIVEELTTDLIELSELNTPEINPDAKVAFEALVSKSVASIKAGRFKKLVTSRKESITIKSNVIEIYKKLLDTYPSAFRYCFYTPQTGLWMGATPEQLLKAENRTIHTVALAGTQLYNEGETAVWESKEREEQQFVTDYILKEINPFAEQLNTTEPYTFRAGNIVHLKTDISAELKAEANLEDIIKTLHPTPAVCGLPTADAQMFLLDNEGYDRKYYSGFLGELNCDFETGKLATDLFVNLRCMKVESNIAHLFIGCGITKDSDPEKEFFETVNKSMTMRRVL